MAEKSEMKLGKGLQAILIGLLLATVFTHFWEMDFVAGELSMATVMLLAIFGGYPAYIQKKYGKKVYILVE